MPQPNDPNFMFIQPTPPRTTPRPPVGAPSVDAASPTPQAFTGAQSGALGQYNNWAQSGGLDPRGWMGLGGQQDTSFLNSGNWTHGNVDPTQVTATDPQHGFDSFIDNAYEQSTRQLDPQWQQAQQSFDQEMVNRGIAPGSAAYTAASADFTRGRNDAYSQARSQAQQQGLAAQGQAFGQGLSQSQLSNQLANALIGANTSYANQQLGGNASLMNQLLGGNSGIAQSLIGAAASRFGSSTSANASMYGANLANQLGMADLNQRGQQMDFGNLMQLLNLGQGTTQYNNTLLNQDQTRNQNLYSGLPGAGQQGNIDVSSPYNNQYNGQMNSWNYQNQQANAQNNNYAQWAALAASLYGGG